MEHFSENMRHICSRMWQMGYGTIHGLPVRGGDPQPDQPFRVTRKVRLTETRPPGRRVANPAFTPKPEHLRFQQELAAIRDGVVDIKVHDGLPVDLEIHEQS